MAASILDLVGAALVGGNGSEADWANANPGGDNYVYNQTAFDAIDNGTVSKDAGTASVSTPAWQSGLQSLLGLASAAAPVVAILTGSTTSPSTKVAAPKAGAPAGGAQSTSTSGSWWVAALAVGLAIVGFVFLGRGRR
jgi:hypothetical protein